MKILPFFAVLLAPALSWAAPQIGVEQAVKLAQANLKERGLSGQVYISSVVLEAQRSESVWNVKWSEIIALEGDKKESGLQIDMAGGVARMVTNPVNRNPVSGKFDPNGRTGLQNHRTRSDRPSILDLKH